MALGYAHGVIQVLSSDTAGTTKTVSGLSFQPKALRFSWNGIQSATNAGGAGNIHQGVGFAVSTSSRRCVGTFQQGAAATTVCGTVARDDAVVCTTDGAAASDGEVDLDAINSDGFQLIVDDQLPVSLSIFWEAWGGSDITVAAVGDIAEPAATGNQNYTVTGFNGTDTDQIVMFAGVQSIAALNSAEAEAAGLCIGYANGTGTSNIVIGGNQDDGSNVSDADQFQLSGQCLGMITLAGAATVQARASFVSFGTDQFTLNWAARGRTGRRNIFLALKGGQWAVGETTLDVTTLNATTTVSGLAFAPKGFSLISPAEQAATASNVAVSGWKMGWGCASSTSSRRSMWTNDSDAADPTNCVRLIAYDSVVVHSSGTIINGQVDVSAFNSDGFTLIVDDAIAGASASTWIGYLAFGNAPTAAEIIPDLVVARIGLRG